MDYLTTPMVVESVLAVVEAVHWPAAFYLFSAFSVMVLEPLASPENQLAPLKLKKMIQTFVGFGKTLDVQNNKHSLWVRYFTVPKSWFRHFYVVSSSAGLLSCSLLCSVYWLRQPPPSWLVRLLDLLTTANRSAHESSVLSVVCVVLLTVQCCARLHECYCVSVFSGGAVMNVLQYGVGFLHYLCAFTVLLSETQALVGDTRQVGGADLRLSAAPGDAWRLLLGVSVFSGAFLLQRDTMRRLARLRTSSTRGGASSGGQYVLPTGGGFQWVSCPHMAAEVTMYAALMVMQLSLAWAALLLFVLSNQVHVALSNHRWYRSKFKEYPATRKAILPWLL